MSNLTIGVIGAIVCLLLIFTRMRVGITMMFVGLFGSVLMVGWGKTLNLLSAVAYSQISSYTLSCIPLFILMGTVLSITGMGGALYNFARAILGKVKGGLAMATVVACGLFAAVCGDSTATAATMGKVAYPEMKAHGYQDKLSASTIVAGGTIGIMIPPSITFIMYGLITETSIGTLFMAGIIPGITQLIFYLITIAIFTRVSKNIAPSTITVPMKEKLATIKPVLPVVIIFILLFGGLYTGLFTPTEAGAVCALLTVIVGIVIKKLNLKNFISAVKDALLTSCMVYFIFLGAYCFMRFMSLSGLPGYLSATIVNYQTNNNVPPVVIILLIIAVYTVTGCFLDSMAVLLLTLPIMFPIVTNMGFDPIWYGVIMVRMMETSMITPPFGLNLFTVAKTVNVAMPEMYKGIFPFIISDIIHIVMLILIPEIALYIPHLMGM
ncbi:MAG: TRAP transporter large permease [Clostridiales Family XIII bacterium]|jgi:tripartite ATP-independent transporter DctM subunit|nr:TRAP transporter large permease [Clostridiales Family XIII bacterium]